MLVVLLKSVITFFLVWYVVRLMGKRQLGEMQPFELVITLIIAEVACIPMNDPYIPFYAGVVPIVTLGFLQILISTIARKSLAARKIISGSSVIVIDKDGINYENLKMLNMNINDLIEASRGAGYPDFSEIAYAIFETNGNLCVIEKPSDPTLIEPPVLPVSLVTDGKWSEENLELCRADKDEIVAELEKNGVDDVGRILYLDVRQNGVCYVAPKDGKSFDMKATVDGGRW